jgi:hypothetical protein
MDHYKSVVLEYLQSDRTVFLNTRCCLLTDEPAHPEKSSPAWFCDAVAIDLRHRAVYLCDVAYKLQALLKKITAWAQNWDSIQAALQRNCKLPPSWRTHVWLFVPRETIETLDARLEDLRRSTGCPFKVKITAIEDVQPWRFWTWDHCDPLADQTVRGREGI